MKKQIKKLKEDIETLGNGFSRFKTESKQEIEDLSTGFDDIMIWILRLISLYVNFYV